MLYKITLMLGWIVAPKTLITTHGFSLICVTGRSGFAHRRLVLARVDCVLLRTTRPAKAAPSVAEGQRLTYLTQICHPPRRVTARYGRRQDGL